MACKSEESPKPTKLTTRFCTRSSRSSPWDLGAPPQVWEQYSIHGRMVDLYRYKMDSGNAGPYKGSPLSLKQPWQWTVWLPVHRSCKGQGKQTKTTLFWQLNAIHLHSHQKRISMVIERKQLRFGGIVCHKPSVTPFHNTTQI